MTTMKKYNQPLMLEENELQSVLNTDFKERELSSYTELVAPNTAKLKVYGPLMKHGNWWTDFLGLSAYSSITKEFKRLLVDSKIQNIILDIDSPGGMVSGCGELANLIYNSQENKNIVSYVSGMGCSAAYYLASATSKVYANQSAKIGSIGVVACINDDDSNTKTIEIVSSKSKDKRLDVQTEAGKAKIQQEVDILGDIFISDVARFRDINASIIEQTNGGSFIGQQAMNYNLIDEVSDFETILKEFAMEQTTQATTPAIDTADIIAKERARASAISAKANELKMTNLGDMLIQSNLSEDEAVKHLESAKLDIDSKYQKAQPTQSTDFAKVMADTKNPTIEPKVTIDDDDEESLVNALVSSANHE